MIEVITKVEHAWSQPSGSRWWLRKSIILLADWVPGLAFGGMITALLWRIFMNGYDPHWTAIFTPVIVVLLVMMMLHLLIALLLPLRWPAIRGQFHDQLRQRLFEELEQRFNEVPADVTHEVLAERRQVETFLNEIREVTGWLEQRDQAASIVH